MNQKIAVIIPCYNESLTIGKVVKDYKEATRWYASAANAGNQYAQVRLGKMYESGKGIGHDLKEAAKWYEKAADQGNNNAKWHLQKVKAKMGE